MADVPEHYADTVNVNLSTYGVSLTFGVRSPLNEPEPKVRLHMSHAMAVVVARLMRRMLLQLETEAGAAVLVPHNVLVDLRITNTELEEMERVRNAAIETRRA